MDQGILRALLRGQHINSPTLKGRLSVDAARQAFGTYKRKAQPAAASLHIGARPLVRNKVLSGWRGARVGLRRKTPECHQAARARRGAKAAFARVVEQRVRALVLRY